MSSVIWTLVILPLAILALALALFPLLEEEDEEAVS